MPGPVNANETKPFGLSIAPLVPSPRGVPALQVSVAASYEKPTVTWLVPTPPAATSNRDGDEPAPLSEPETPESSADPESRLELALVLEPESTAELERVVELESLALALELDRLPDAGLDPEPLLEPDGLLEHAAHATTIHAPR